MVSAQAEARDRGLLRPFQRRALSPRHLDPALASRQGPAAMQLRAAEAEGGGSDEAAWMTIALVPRTQRRGPPPAGSRLCAASFHAASRPGHERGYLIHPVASAFANSG